MAQPGLGNRGADGQRRSPACWMPLGDGPGPAASGSQAVRTRAVGLCRRKPDSSLRGQSDDREPRHDPVLGGGAAAVGLPGPGRLARGPGQGRGAPVVLPHLLRGTGVRQGTARVPGHPGGRGASRTSRPGWSGSWPTSRRADGPGPHLPAGDQETVHQAYAAIATPPPSIHEAPPTAPSDSEIDKAWAQRRAMSLEDAAAYTRSW